MARDCFGNYPNTSGFPCILCDDCLECRVPLIKEGSKLIIYINNDKHSEVEAMENIRIYPNSITMLDGMLLCTDGNKPVIRIEKGIYEIYCWYQDCFYINDGKAYESISNT
ncbi:hypothetical protein FDC45_17810 [Clostridium botulinum]|uniref:Uncharacterized protein n=1 Tax=Clostridium botulinum TaxID=1491 RepID=A0A846JHD4_CLOBO|nr:hypothetical protein [Clostridium botulinum]ACA57378.1 hypothetical protein CLK_A0250 [Clostridium botulinum A3 str. Loch Maree]NFH67025.1 hypothetical protein [Clostridium botulinum]NFJ09614.1 hypothetical protein [Clostridium botulinum]NFK16583.1 hypothetical protein [Clostridium botulinum]NFM94308.1 hypothetical protein [Clostridium botulinum]